MTPETETPAEPAENGGVGLAPGSRRDRRSPRARGGTLPFSDYEGLAPEELDARIAAAKEALGPGF